MRPPTYVTGGRPGQPLQRHGGIDFAKMAEAPTRRRSRPAELSFAAGILLITLLLQRFGLQIGAAGMNIVGPIGLLLGLRGLIRGELSIHTGRLKAYLALLFCITVGTVEQTLFPPALFVVSSPLSVLQFLLLSSFATLSFTHRVDELTFFSLINKGLALIAAAGILQFALQTVGISFFSFEDIVPASILSERGWNLIIPSGVGALLKSNGMFLNEPSIFSQFMAIGLIIELLAFRRIAFCALYMVALLVSFSGTGWIVIATFIVAVAGGLGTRGLLLALAAIALIGVGLLGIFLFAPDMIPVLGDRASEIFYPGTSGHMRFITPFWALNDVLDRVPAAFLFGIGGGMSEHLTLPYEYDVNTPIKIILEFGVPALICYLMLLVIAERTPLQRALVAPCIVLLLITGSYSQFPPILFFMLLLIAVARLEPSATSAVTDASART